MVGLSIDPVTTPDIESNNEDQFFIEDERKDTLPPFNPNLVQTESSRGVSGLSMSNIISTIATSASSSALFGSGTTPKNVNSSSFNVSDFETFCLYHVDFDFFSEG